MSATAQAPIATSAPRNTSEPNATNLPAREARTDRDAFPTLTRFAEEPVRASGRARGRLLLRDCFATMSAPLAENLGDQQARTERDEHACPGACLDDLLDGFDRPARLVGD